MVQQLLFRHKGRKPDRGREEKDKKPATKDELGLSLKGLYQPSDD
jgi:hypothetical protein